MGWRVTQNPETGKYQIFSSIVDAFILEEEIDRDDLRAFWISEFGENGKTHIENILISLDTDGPYPFSKWKQPYKELKMWNDHSMGHEKGSMSGRNGVVAEDCKICQEIEHEELLVGTDHFGQKGD